MRSEQPPASGVHGHREYAADTRQRFAALPHPGIERILYRRVRFLRRGRAVDHFFTLERRDDVSLFLGGPAGPREADGSPFTVGRFPQAVALADLNGDGRADIVTGNAGSQDLSVLLSP